MSSRLAVLLLFAVFTLWARPRSRDDWTIVALDTVKTEDVANPGILEWLQDPHFRNRSAKSQKILLGLEPYTSELKLRTYKKLLAQPTQRQLTVKHHGYIYKAWCYGTDFSLYGPAVPVDLRILDVDTCGQLMAPYVGQILPTWPTLSHDGSTVGLPKACGACPGQGLPLAELSADPEGFLILHEFPRPSLLGPKVVTREFLERYLIFSVERTKP